MEHRIVTFTENQSTSGRNKFWRKFKNHKVYITFTEDTDSWDANVSSQTGTAIVEIKDRDIQYDAYDRPGKRDGYMIEKLKYEPMMAAYEASGCTPIFMIFFQDGIGYWWDLSEYDSDNIKWEKMWCTHTTANGTYGKHKKLKTFFNVFLKDGKRFYYE